VWCLVTPEPRKRPRSSYLRFQAELPNQCWQSDFTNYRLTRPTAGPGADTEILGWLDDHSYQRAWHSRAPWLLQ
jgi:hypothetical protein